jgi:hypothetical protein
MEFKVNPQNVRQGTAVKLTKDLPTGHGFGNSCHIRSPNHYGQLRSGQVTGDGFENGMLEVTFELHPEGTQKVRFNPESAAAFLVTDIY